jgi:hypothetical protein
VRLFSDTEKVEILIESEDEVLGGKKVFQNRARKRLCFAKEACCGLCSESKTTHNAITNHAQNNYSPKMVLKCSVANLRCNHFRLISGQGNAVSESLAIIFVVLLTRALHRREDTPL